METFAIILGSIVAILATFKIVMTVKDMFIFLFTYLPKKQKVSSLKLAKN